MDHRHLSNQKVNRGLTVFEVLGLIGLFFVVLPAVVGNSWEYATEQHQEVRKLRKDVDEKRRELESIKAQVEQVQRSISAQEVSQ